MVPDAPNAEAYREKGTRFLLNGNSRSSDAFSEALFDGRPLKEWHVGANYTETLGLYHHDYLNIGYMVISLSNLAMLHFAYRLRGQEAPKALYHNFAELWQLVRTCTFEDGRLLRIGGDTRARYCYCQDYLLPVWAMVEDHLGQSCAALEDGWLAQITREMAANNDGSFLSARLSSMMDASPLYYTRLESDRANAFSMAACWQRTFGMQPTKPLPAPDAAWHCDFHGAQMVCGQRRAASFVWRAAELPTGLCLPTNRSSDMAEWRYSLAGHIEGDGSRTTDHYERHDMAAFPGGFITSGISNVTSDLHMAEGQRIDHMARRRLAFAALPDDRTVLCIQTATASTRVHIKYAKGLMLHMPNDLWNGCQRQYENQHGTHFMRGMLANEAIPFGSWLTVDGALSVALPQGESLTLLRGDKRQIQILRNMNNNHFAREGTLYCDEIIADATLRRRWYAQGETFYDVAFAVAVDGADGAHALSQSMTRSAQGDVRLLFATASGKRYLLALNVSDADTAFVTNDALTELSTGVMHAAGTSVTLTPAQAKFFTLA